VDVTSKKWKHILLSGGALLSPCAKAMDLSSFKFLLNFYDQSGNSGKQVYDNSGNEDVTVFEPMLFVVANVDEETNVNAQFVLDAWTAASDTALDGNTGASGAGKEGQTRVSGNLGYKKGNDLNNWSTRIGVSTEYDYRSLNFGGTLVRSYAEDNFTLAITPQLFLDQAKAFDFTNYQTTDFQDRVIYSLDVSGTQLLTVRDLLQGSVTYIGMNGYLNNISSTVRVLDNTSDPFQRQAEQLPSSRSRLALSTKWVHGFNETTAMHVNYRYYTDDWKIKAHSPEVGIRFALFDGESFLMPTFRYHTQTAAKFYQDFFPTSFALMTSDSDLSKFHSERLGVHYGQGGKEVVPFGLKSTLEWSVAAYGETRSNDLDMMIFQAGAGLTF